MTLFEKIRDLVEANSQIYGDKKTMTYIQFKQYLDGVEVHPSYWSIDDMKKLKLSGYEITAYLEMVKELTQTKI